MANLDKHLNGSVQKAFLLLEAFTHDKPEWGVSELARSLGANKSTTYRLLATLEKLGVLQQNRGTEKYRLGLKLFELGHRVSIHQAVEHCTHPALEEVAQAIAETVHLAMLEGSQIRYIDKVESPQGLKISTEIGSLRPAYCTGIGKVLMAYSSPDLQKLALEQGKLLAQTPNTIYQLREIKKALVQIREQGFAVDREEYEIGLVCVAVPVFNQAGELVAGLSASGPANRFREEALLDYVAILQKGAAKIQHGIGKFQL